MPKTVHARERLRILRQPLPLHRALPTLRALAATTLLAAVVIGGIRFLTLPPSAGAIEFTPHNVVNSKSAVGILGSAIADIDGDKDNDVVTAGIDGVNAYLNGGMYTFTKKGISGARGERVQVADFNKDGKLDLLVSLQGQRPGVVWYRNNGGMVFDETVVSSGNNDVAGFGADLDNDQDTDIVAITDDGAGTKGLRVWQNDGGGTFTALWSASNTGTTTVTAGKIDGEAYVQIVTGGLQGLQRWQTSNGTTWNRSDIDDDNGNKTYVTVADVDGDDQNDIITTDQAENKVAVYQNRGSNNFTRHVVPGDTDATTAVPADLDNDGGVDLVVAGQDQNSVYWFDNRGALEFARLLIADGLQSVFGVAVGDLDQDGDLDVFAGNHTRGRAYAFERTRVKPKATEPTAISQSKQGTGKISWQTTISDGDFDPTRIRIQYSLNGHDWQKPYLTKVTADKGLVDLKNSNGFQIGTANPIDTNDGQAVTLTIHWDTKSVQNTGGALTGDQSAVQLRVLPRDAKDKGSHAVSRAFQVDNQPPQQVTSLSLPSIGVDSAQLAWPAGRDRSAVSYQIYYGTDQTAVLEQRSSVWNSDNDEKLSDSSTTTTTITGLAKNSTYTFKLVTTDSFGNAATTPGIRGTTTLADPSPLPTTSPLAPSPSPTSLPPPTASAAPPTGPTTPTTSPISKAPSVLQGNRPPQADAGPDLVVNPSALVVLDGTASHDADGDATRYTWRQLAGDQVELFSARTSTPSFSAGAENETYIFSLTVADSKGAIATDTVTVATKSLPDVEQAPVAVGTAAPPVAPPPRVAPSIPPLVSTVLHPANLVLFALSLLSTLLLLLERFYRALRRGVPAREAVSRRAGEVPLAQGKVVHYSTGEGLAGVQVLIYAGDGKLKASERTNEQGVFPTFFPAGEYTIGVDSPGFSFASAASRALAPAGGILYTGGKLVVKDANQPLSLVIPMKPVAATVGSFKIRLLHLWQNLQHGGRVASWPIFLLGALLNTALVFVYPRASYLVLEITYVVLVIVKIALEVRVRPAYGQVRDAITHIPLDLAVVRLFEQGSNRLVMTRVTNNQGKFFALPPAGTYTVTITKPGYANFSKQDVAIQSEHDTTLQMIADLLPIAPHPSGLAQARASVL